MIQEDIIYAHSRFLILSILASISMFTVNALAADSNVNPIKRNQIIFLSGDIKEAMTYSEFQSDTEFLTRLRFQVEASVTEDLGLKGRINATKLYDSESFDDDDFLVDRFYFSWRDSGNKPFYFLGGRLPTTGETSPSHLRLGLNHPSESISSYTDIVLDGVLLGYNDKETLPGTLEFYYASQFDEGYESNENNSGLADTDIYGFKWDFLQNKTRSIRLQSFLISGLWNIPEHVAIQIGNIILPRTKLGDIYQTSFTYLDNFQNINLFLNLGWSHTNPEAMDEFGTSLLSSWWDEPQNENGYSAYVGLRYDIDNIYSKIGFEYNYGSKYWINFSQDSETAKLATRGSVAEAYLIFAPPLATTFSKYIQSIIGRIGYQYYDYKYTGSGFWLGEPIKISDIKNDPLAAQFYSPIETEFKVYAAIEIYF